MKTPFFLQETALEADQVYLAAIDKFDATTSRNNGYAVDGIVLGSS